MNDSNLIECVRARSEIYDKDHAGFKNPAIEESAWESISEAVHASVSECTARWNTLRERFGKERQLIDMESQSGSGTSGRPVWVNSSAMSFLIPHIRKRKSIDNLAPSEESLPSPSSVVTTDDEVSDFLSEGSFEVAHNELVDLTSEKSPASPQSSGRSTATGSTLDSASSLSYLGSCGQCKKRRNDNTTEIFRQTLLLFNKILVASSHFSPKELDADSLIGKSVEVCLKNLKHPLLKIQFRKEFMEMVQECEEAALLE